MSEALLLSCYNFCIVAILTNSLSNPSSPINAIAFVPLYRCKYTIKGVGEGIKNGLLGLLVPGPVGPHLMFKVVVGGGMKRSFLSQKASGVGRGVKDKSLNMRKMDTGIGLFTASDGTCNDVGLFVDKSTVMEGVTPSMIDMTVEKDKLSSLEDTTVLGSFPPLPTLVTTSAGNALGKSSYANIIGKTSEKKVNARTLFTPVGNIIDVGRRWHTLLLLTMSSYARVMVELRADVELNDNIVVAMPKITIEGHYTCNVHVEYEWKPHMCSSCKVFGHIHEECTKNTSSGEKKTVKKPCQTSRSVLVGPKMDFKPQKEYRPVPRKPNVSSSGNKKKRVEPTIEISNSNPFDVLNSVDNDGEFGTNGETTNLVNNKATSSRSSFMNMKNVREFARNTHIGEKIDKIQRQIGEGKLRLLDKEGNMLVPIGGTKGKQWEL
nr:hypothetical protein [Tanacetum cinerariifolium]